MRLTAEVVGYAPVARTKNLPDFIRQRVNQQSVVELTMVGGELIISVTNEPDRTLDDLLALVTPENLHAEDEFGMPVGKEHW